MTSTTIGSTTTTTTTIAASTSSTISTRRRCRAAPGSAGPVRRVGRAAPRPSPAGPGTRSCDRRRPGRRYDPPTAVSRTARPRRRRCRRATRSDDVEEIGPVTHHGDLVMPRAQVGGGQGVEKAVGAWSRTAPDELQDAVGVVGVARLAGQRGEAVQRDRGERVGRWGGVVEEVLLPGDERSPSSGVVNSPPWSTSQKWSSRTSAAWSPRRSSAPRRSLRRAG